MLQAAEYDAVVSITHADPPYLLPVDAPGRARPDAAADQAAHDVLTALYPQMAPAVNQLLAAELKAIPDGTAKLEGIKVGSTVAARLVQERSSDGSGGAPAAFVPGTGPGDYRPTPPNFPAPVFTNWGTIRPFVLERGNQFRPAAPPEVTGADYAAALNEVVGLETAFSFKRWPVAAVISRIGTSRSPGAMSKRGTACRSALR